MDADYDWGDGVMLDSIQPGDILQFRNHLVHSSTLQLLDNGKWFETEESTARRPAPHRDRSRRRQGRQRHRRRTEQSGPDPKKVMRSVIPKLDAGEDTRWIDKSTRSVEGDRLGPRLPSGRQTPKGRQPPAPGKSVPAGRALAYVVPSRGVPSARPGPSGQKTHNIRMHLTGYSGLVRFRRSRDGGVRVARNPGSRMRRKRRNPASKPRMPEIKSSNGVPFSPDCLSK